MISEIYAQTLFNFLYSNVDGYRTATISQSAKPGSREELLYGEIPFETWKQIVERANPKADGIFYDLGSGTGRVAMQSHLLHDFKKSVAIELLDGLHEKALEVKKIFETIVKPTVVQQLADRELVFKQGNILTTDFSDGDFILLSHPFKDEDDFLTLEEKFLKTLKPKTKIVTLIRFLRNEKFKSLGFKVFKFGWGKSTAYFYEVE
jgi:SAM-dependent methyltransferase